MFSPTTHGKLKCKNQKKKKKKQALATPAPTVNGHSKSSTENKLLPKKSKKCLARILPNSAADQILKWPDCLVDFNRAGIFQLLRCHEAAVGLLSGRPSSNHCFYQNKHVGNSTITFYGLRSLFIVIGWLPSHSKLGECCLKKEKQQWKFKSRPMFNC